MVGNRLRPRTIEFTILSNLFIELRLKKINEKKNYSDWFVKEAIDHLKRPIKINLA